MLTRIVFLPLIRASVVLAAIAAALVTWEACVAGVTPPGAQQKPTAHVDRKILLLLEDGGSSDDQKARELAKIRGSLTAQGTASVLKFLGKSEGNLFVAIALCLERCGAGKDALSVAQAIVSDKSSSTSQFAPALYFVQTTLSDSDTRGSMRLLRVGTKALIERLRNPRDVTAMLALLRARQFIWYPGSIWTAESEIGLQLCRLVEAGNPEVQREAAGILSISITPDLVPGSTVIPLAKATSERDPETTRNLNKLLGQVLGIGPENDELPVVRAFWGKWLREKGPGFSLPWNALERASTSAGSPFRDRLILGNQIAFSCRELPKEERYKAWAALRRIFEEDKSSQAERCAAWLWPLVKIASGDDSDAITADCLRLLINMAQGEDKVLRGWALASLGDLSGATSAGSPARQMLDKTLADEAAPPEERANAAWSLRRAIKGDSQLLERMIALAEKFQALPEKSFTTMSRDRCVGQIFGALSEATGKHLSFDPSEWRKALADFLPAKK